MQPLKFAWPHKVYGSSRKPIEQAMESFITRAAPVGTFCHEGEVMVDIAQTLPTRERHNAVLVCSCGKPRAALQFLEDDALNWTFHQIALVTL